jgi:NADH-quinone oxidoreductase subunit C
MDENEKPQSVPPPEGSGATSEAAPKPGDESKPGASGKPEAEAKAIVPKAAAEGKPATGTSEEAAAPAGETPKPAAKPAAKPAPPKAPAVMQAEPWEGEIPAIVKDTFGEGVLRAATYREQDFFEVSAGTVIPLLQLLRDDFDYDYLVEETAVDYPKEEKRFELVYILYSFARNHRIRVKTRVAEGEEMASAVPVYASANWMEREIYDMFGVRFRGHPDLRRILMPDDWQGYPLRKDYGIIQQDQRWVQENLSIESGQ